jgi:hypothetical protein
MTGGTATHDMIVWGPTAAEQQRRKAAADPLLRVPISSELGCITPWVVFPGAKWEQPELLHHARALAIAFMDNNSCNCLSPKVRPLAPQLSCRPTVRALAGWPACRSRVRSVTSHGRPPV